MEKHTPHYTFLHAQLSEVRSTQNWTESTEVQSHAQGCFLEQEKPNHQLDYTSAKKLRAYSSARLQFSFNLP